MASFQAIDVSTDPPLSSERRPQQAGSYKGSYLSKHICISPVGASLLAMDVNDNAGCLNERVIRSFFAGKPRSYRESCLLLIFTTHQAER